VGDKLFVVVFGLLHCYTLLKIVSRIKMAGEEENKNTQQHLQVQLNHLNANTNNINVNSHSHFNQHQQLHHQHQSNHSNSETKKYKQRFVGFFQNIYRNLCDCRTDICDREMSGRLY
jgi:hypothetical protein